MTPTFTQYLEATIKERFEEMAQPDKRFPAPKGFKKVYTGGNIYMYAGTLSNGKYVELFGDDDIGKDDEGFNVIDKDVQDTNVARLYTSEKADKKDSVDKGFRTAAELQKILDSWSK